MNTWHNRAGQHPTRRRSDGIHPGVLILVDVTAPMSVVDEQGDWRQMEKVVRGLIELETLGEAKGAMVSNDAGPIHPLVVNARAMSFLYTFAPRHAAQTLFTGQCMVVRPGRGRGEHPRRR